MDGKEKSNPINKIMTVLGSVLCVIFGFLLACNLYIIVQGYINPDTPPSLFGQTPLIVLSGSMSGTQEGHLEVGDLILVQKTDTSKLKKGDVIAYDDGKSIITHRIYAIDEKQITTKGDANNAPDSTKIVRKQVIGTVSVRFAKIGDLALFMQTPTGMMIFIGIPFAIYLFYDLFIARRNKHKKDAEKEAMMEELERLRALNKDDINIKKENEE